MIGFPYKIWQLLVDPDVAHELLATAECLLDEFSRKFLSRFHTIELLQSADCRALLVFF